MTLAQKILGVTALGVAFINVSFADVTATSEGSLLGKRYAELGFGYVDVNHSGDDILAAGFSSNLPVTPSIDVALSYAYSWVDGAGANYANAVNATAIGYLTEGALRPFGRLGVGYNFLADAYRQDDFASWNGGVGFEYTFGGNNAVRVSVDYNDAFESDAPPAFFSGTAGVSRWFTDKIGATASITWIERGDIGYAASLLFKF